MWVPVLNSWIEEATLLRLAIQLTGEIATSEQPIPDIGDEREPQSEQDNDVPRAAASVRETTPTAAPRNGSVAAESPTKSYPRRSP